jgi:hypothetical protein
MEKELEKKSVLLKITGDILNSILEGLSQVDPETRMKIMELCGEACAREEVYGSAIEIAARIAKEEVDEGRIIGRANEEILWCGKWARKGETIQCTCTKCGCPLVRNEVVRLTGMFCYCSRGWVKTIFVTLLKKPVRVELEKAIGFGDDVCRYVVYMQ